MQCYTSLYPLSLRAADGSKGGLTNIYLGLNHPAVDWLYANEYARVSDWLYANEFVLGSGTAVGRNNLAYGICKAHV